ncbi:beta-mannosidase, glycoside hydrolase family 2 protein [Rhodotorula toruloides]|uniref:beta-mannosidase n=1 Tax=Rhodotorula toruloides TaxID=5286 RepID=A0A511KH50_RHOTO|nr:beta-mannosidase, glycoside hydrolase family 2 protein [Rhodotorula toruloides]
MRVQSLSYPLLWSWRRAPSTHDASLSLPLSSTAHQQLSLSQDEAGFRPVAQFPSVIHEELLAVGEIPDPFLGRNEEAVQWVGEADWIYRCEFEVERLPEKRSKDGEHEEEKADLVFEGLDTFATAYLNGDKILEADNMFREWRVPIRPSGLRRGRNSLYFVFHSAFRRGRELQTQVLGRNKSWPAWNGDPSRLFVRKAQYQYGWDWGPTLMTAGPWRPVRLEVYRSRIVDLRSTGEVLDSVTRRVGFRRLRVARHRLEHPPQPGHTFLFEVNNVPFFSGGSNWIPIDSILTRATKSRYGRWLKLAKAGNQKMIRVWGGGIYEDEAFYKLCDELGLLVWQDFMFACGAYPAQVDDFRANVEAEVDAVVKRLRTHPSLAIFAGNNEDYQIAEAEKLEYDPEDETGDWLVCSAYIEKVSSSYLFASLSLPQRTNFPARELYERVFPGIVQANSDTFYWPGSPWGGKSTRDQVEGDVHVWDVWHGSQLPYQDYGQLSGRFVSEFGAYRMQGAPSVRTIDAFLAGETSERFTQSKTMDAHNKAVGHARRLATYVAENIRAGTSLEDNVYATQFVQAEAVHSAFSSWRRKFRGGVEGAECAGALVWQLNDVWPCTSWSIVDYFLRPKPAYFAMKRALAPLALSGRRSTEKTFPDPTSVADFVEKTHVEFWVASSELEEREVIIKVVGYELSTGQRLVSGRMLHERWTQVVRPNEAVELRRFTVPNDWNDVKTAVVVFGKLTDAETGETLSRVSLWPEPFKYLAFPSEADTDINVSLARRGQDIGEIRITAQRPVKGLVLNLEPEAELDDNFLDLAPGDEQMVLVKGLRKGTQVSWRHLGN